MATTPKKAKADAGSKTAPTVSQDQYTKRTGRKKRYREKGAGSIYKRGKRFYLRSMINGKIITKALLNQDGEPCTSEKEAEKAAEAFRKYNLVVTKQDYINQVAEVKSLKRQYSLTIRSAWRTYCQQPTRPDSGEKTLSKYESMFRCFTDWLAIEHPEIEHISAIDYEIASAFMDSLWNDGLSAVTYNAYLQALRMIFKHLRGVAELEKNPFEEIPKKPNAAVSRKEFTEEQVKAIFRGFKDGFKYQLKTGKEKYYTPLYKDEMRVLFLLCCYTGCRGQDGCLMQWRDIDLENGLISFVPRKTAKKSGYRHVELRIFPVLLDALKDAARWRDDNKHGEDFILPHIADRYRKNPSGIQKDTMKIIRLATGLETTLQKDDLNGRQRKIGANAYGLHSFRHTFVSLCANAGVPLSVVAEIVGHGNPAMTAHYSHASQKAKGEAIKTLPMFCEPTAEQEDEVIEEEFSQRRKLICDALPRATAEALSAIETALKEYNLL